MTRSLLSTLVLLFSCFSSFAQVDIWAEKFTGSSYQAMFDAAVDSTGAVYIVGTSYNAASIGGTSVASSYYDAVVAKLDSEGNTIWAQKGGGVAFTEFDGAMAVETDPYGHLYVGGTFEGNATFGNVSLSGTGSNYYDAFLVKYDTAGNAIWGLKQGGAGNSRIIEVAVDSDGKPVVLSIFNSQITIDSITFTADTSSQNMYAVTKYDTSGNLEWTKLITTGNSYIYNYSPWYIANGGVAVDGNDDVVVTGVFRDSIVIESSSAVPTGWSGYRDAFLAKFDGSDGDLDWLRTGGGSNHDFGSDVVVDDNNNIYMSGWGYSSKTFGSVTVTPPTTASWNNFAVKYSSSGNAQSGFAVGTFEVWGYYYYRPVLDIDADGKLLMAGTFYNDFEYGSNELDGNGTRDRYTLRYDFSSSSFDFAFTDEDNTTYGWNRAIEAYGQDAFYVAGTMFGTIDFGTNSLTSSSYDGFITQYIDCDNLVAQANAVGPASFCDGEDVDLEADTNSGYSYQWLFNGSAVSGQVNYNYNVDAAGDYSVVIDSAGCVDTSNVITVTVNSLPTVTQTNFSSACDEDDPFTLTGGSPSGGTYSGTGVTGGSTFDPGAAALGNNTIWYVYTDGNGCSDSVSKTLTVNQSPAIFTTSISACENDAPVSLSGAAYGFPTGGTHSGTGVSGTTFVPSSAGAGTHSIFYTSSNGCQANDSIVATVTAAPSVNLPALSNACITTSFVTLTSGTPFGGTYSGTGVSTPFFFPNVAGAGTHQIVYSYTASGCTGTDTADITVDTVPDPVFNVLPAMCDGDPSINLNSYVNPVGGTFSGTGVSDTTFSPVTSGTGNFTITYSITNSCGTDTAQRTATVDDIPTISIVSTNVLCNGGSTGTATASATGGSGFSYSWSNGSSAAAQTGLTAGTYTVTVTNSSSCSDTAMVTITEPSALTVNTTTTAVSCNGGNDGIASAFASGGTSGYTYAWNTGGTGGIITGLTAGTYTVTVTDANACTETANAVVTEPTAVSASISSSTNVSCNGGSDGSATASGSGGTSPYSYAWNTGGTSASVTGLTAGTYTVTVTDNNSCTDTETVTITEPTAVSASISSSTNVSCNGGSDGSATASGSGGTSPYSYSWNTGGTSASVTGLTAGTYTVTVTDNNSCTDTETVTITQPATAVSVSITSSTNVSCNGGSDGSATASGSGGTGSISYTWSTGATSASVTGLTAGTYTVTAEDANGCEDTAMVTITEPTSLIASSVVDSNVSCNGYSDGGATASATGGTGAYSYVWSNSATTASITGVVAGTYSVTITDANGCTDSSSVTITEPTSLIASTVVDSNVSCNGGSDGGATASAAGGTMAYSYLWSNSATTSSITGVVAGTYSVTVTDANGCTDSSSVTITEPASMIAAAAVDSNVSCNGGSDGGATASATGGTTAYSYAWSNGATTASITGIVAGTYSVTVTDANGCTDSASVSITEPTMLVSSAALDSNVSCNGGSDGGAMASATGGTGAYSYMWSNSATTASITGVVAGTYSVTITDGNGCTDSSSVTITEPSALIASTVVDSNVSCNGYSDGGATASGTGGTGAYSYMWSNSATTASITGVVVGTYSVTITDANGCTDSSSVTITEPASMIAAAVVDSNVSCNGGSDGGATASATGGTTAYSYSWSNGATTASVTGLAAGTYSVTITDANGCTDSSSVTITEPASMIASAVLDSNVSCNGGSDGGATASATGGTTVYSYMWSNSATTASITGVVAGTYSVTVTDANGCTDSASVTITEPTALISSAVVDSNISCNGGSDGGATASATGGTGAYTYSWSNSATTASITGVAAGTYSVTITDANGCTDSSSVTITEPAALIASTVVDSNVSCNGYSDGGATASATGGTGAYSYMWSNSATTASITGVVAGTYSVTITDANGCTDSSSVTITEPASLIASAVVDSNVSCNGGSDGGATASATGGTTAYSYSWSNGSTTASVTGLTAGTYSVTITDANGCTDSASVTITEPGILAATAVVDSNVSCYAGSDGGASASASGGTSPFTFAWSNSATTASITGVTAGTYSVTVTDANGCNFIDSVTITEPTELDVTATVVGNTSCASSASGVGSASGSGGTPAYTFAWSSGSTSSIATGLGTGTHTVTITDANGCTDTTSITIVVQDTIDPVVITANDTVYLDGTGAGTILPSMIDAGSYDSCGIDTMYVDLETVSCSDVGVPVTVVLTVEDVNGNSSTGSATVTVMDTISPTVMAQNASLYIDANGGALVTVGMLDIGTYDSCGIDSMWVSPDTFTCSNVGDTMLVGLYAQDVNGNISGLIKEVYVLDTLSPVVQTQVSLAYVDSAGLAVLDPADVDSGSYDNCAIDTMYVVPGSVSCVDDSVLVTLFVEDIFGNIDSNQAWVLVEDTIAPTFTVAADTFYLDSDGVVSITHLDVVTDSNESCSNIDWTLSQSDFNCSDVGSNSIMVTASDASGNTTMQTVSVTILDTIAPAMMAYNLVTGYLDASGVYVLTTSAADSASYDSCGIASLSLSMDTFTCAHIGVNTVGLTGIDVNGNSSTDSLYVLIMDTLSGLTITGDTGLLCFGDTNGTFTAVPSGMNVPYTYSWSTGDTSATINNLSAGTYTVTVTYATGCMQIDSVELSNPASPLGGALSIENLLCYGDSSGSVTATAFGGTPGYSYLWNTGDTVDSIGGLWADTFAVTITDTNGCMVSLDTFLTQPMLLTTAISFVDSSLCEGDSSGIAIATSMGGVGVHTHSWMPTSVTSGDSLLNIPAGTYVLMTTDTNGCIATDTQTIAMDTLPAAALVIVEDSVCEGLLVSLDSVSPMGGVYSGSTGIMGDTLNTMGLIDWQYVTYTVTDGNGCEGEAMDSVYVIPMPVISFNENPIELCAEEVISLDFASPVGGVYTSLFADTAAGTLTAPDTAYMGLGGTYSLVNSCGADTDTFYLNVHPLPEVNLGNDTMLCNANQLILDAGVHNTYFWSDSSASQTVTLNDGEQPLMEDVTMWVEVSDTFGCVNSDTIHINVEDQPTFYLGDNFFACLDSVVLLSVNGDYDNYMWNDSSTALTYMAHDGSIMTPGAYTHWVTGSNDNGCSYSDTIVITLVDCDSVLIGLDDITMSDISMEVYPNPTRSDFNIRLNGFDRSALETIRLYGILGDLARTYKASDWNVLSDDSVISIETNGITDGVYLMELTTKYGVSTTRVIVGR